MTGTPDVPPPAYSATPSNPPPSTSAFDIRDLLNALHSEHATSQASPGTKSPAPPLPRRKNEQVLDQATYKRVLELAIAIEGPCPPEKFQRFIDHYKSQNDWICSAESYKATFLPETFDPQSAESLSELLFLASCAGDVKVARAAISAGAEVDYVIPRLGDCALNAAFTFDHTEVIEGLFEAGVSVLAVCTRQGINEQEYMARRLPMASPATVRQILSRRGKDALPSSAPLIAAQSCAVGVLQLLFEYEFDFMVQGAGGSSALHLAARQGQLENASYLLSIGYEVNILDTSQQTPLYDAIINCNTEAVKLLLDGGALVNIVDAAGETPMHVLVVQPCASNGTPVQSEAIATIKIEIFLLLCAAGVMLNVANGKGQAPIHVAIKYGLSIMAALLLLAGASPDLTDANGWTPLHLCANGGNDHATIAAFLIEKGASLKARLPPPNPLTPFEVARHFANTTMMPLLRDARRERGLAKWTKGYVQSVDDKIDFLIMPRPNTLLGLPAELRVTIADIVFLDPNEYPPSRFQEQALRPPTLQPVPFKLSLYHTLLHVCRLIRKEALPSYYANKTVELNGNRQLQDAILRLTDTLPMWKHLHIYWEHGSTPMPPRRDGVLRPGYFKASPDGDYDQLVERDFAQLKIVSSLQTLRVDFGALYWALPQPSGALDHTLIEHELCEMLSEHTELRSLEFCAEALTQTQSRG
ncbi:hypothetical protein LTR56_024853 [Elasticomyces elasticus]|nr:hypothetical protein LTR22_026936 [Elasticomyces elasticus]KAK3618135.1 hypothetical protein LTR56_024853 [Elasticomyces elasticus]KAK4917546.1 hypothetical protein LTR49_014632 [Elasticomyces elasticus]KAK5756330.1 hypothetical protein LTS12_013519 [Elasticomyces elasticus]